MLLATLALVQTFTLILKGQHKIMSGVYKRLLQLFNF